MPIYEFKCCRCDRLVELYFKMDEQKEPRCTHCDGMMVRIFSPVAVRPNGITRTPAGQVEIGTEYPKADEQPDRYADVDREVAQVLEQAPDLDGSGDCELARLRG